MTATATTPRPTTGPTTVRRGARTGNSPTAWPRVTAGIHAQGASLKVVIARQDAADALPVVVESLTIPAADPAALASLLAKHKVTGAVRLVPSSSTVARCTALPPGLSSDRAQAAATLSLLAESEMPSLIPAHRRAAGIIRPGASDAVLVVGWPEKGDIPPTPGTLKDLTFTPELVALAALAQGVGGAELALYADRQAGSIALLASPANGHSNGAMNGASSHPKTMARVLRGETSSDAAWNASIRRAVAETAASLGTQLPGVELTDPAPASLVLLGSPMRRPRGMPGDPAWLAGYGIAFGALCALSQQDPAVAPLALLRASAARETAGPLVGAVEYLTNPRRATIAIALCAVAFLLSPLVAAKAREMILAGRAGDNLQERLRDAEHRVAFYQQLRDRRWPMTKLVADIAGAAPVGVHVDFLSLSREQGVTLRGRAEKPEQVTDFRSNLTGSGIFGSVATPNIENEAGAVTFQLEAQVVAPQYAGKRAGDFVAEPLAVRLYGERARGVAPGSSPATASTPADADHAAPSPSSDSGRSGRSSSRSGLRDTPPPADDGAAGGTRRSAGTKSAVPDPLSDADIAKMDRKTAMLEWSTRKSAATKTDDPAIKQRLTEESEKCKARMDALKGSS
jgi:hypothetical protein